MPIAAIEFKPGINREVTNYSNKGGFYDGNKIRFRSGTPEKIGGWANAFANIANNTFNGYASTMFAWETSTGSTYIAMGTNQKYYVNLGGSFFDITPVAGTATLTNPFSTTNGSPYVNVADSTSLTAGTWVTFSGASSVGGLTLNGSYEVIAINSSPTGYAIIASSAATATVSGGGGTVSASYELSAAGSTTAASGWGTGGWGVGGWSVGASSATSANPLRLWSQANFGDYLLFAANLGGLYFWSGASTSTHGITINAQANSSSKTQQTVAATVSSSGTFTVLNSQGIDYGAVVTLVSGTGSIPAGTYVTSAYTGYTTVTVSAPVSLTVGAVISFSYSGATAPTEVGTVLVSAVNQFTVALGSTPYNPQTFAQSYNPMLVRWSDQSIPWEWTPSTSNQSGSQPLSLGSYIVTGLSTRQEILIWTDRALYSMQYIGAPYVFGFYLMMDNISIISPNAAISVNGSTYWMGQDKFYFYNGTVVPLPCTVRKFVFTNINMAQANQIVCGQNEQFNEIWWFYPSKNSTTNNSYVIFNYLENLWYYGTLNRSAWLQSSLFPYPLATFSVQTSYLSAAISSTATTIPLINALTYPSSGTVMIGSEQITYTTNSGSGLSGLTRGANGTTAASHSQYAKVSMTAPNQILYHENGVDDYSTGSQVAINSYLQTADFDINGGDHFGYVWRFLPDFTFQGSTATNPQIYLTLNPRNSAGSSYMTGGDIGNVSDSTVTNTQAAPTPPNTYPVEQFTGTLYSRIRGRQMNFYVSSPNAGVQWQMGTNRFDVRPDGRR